MNGEWYEVIVSSDIDSLTMIDNSSGNDGEGTCRRRVGDLR